MQTAQEILKGNGGGGFGGGNGGIFTSREIWQHIQPLLNPVTPEGYSADYQQVEELDSESVLKIVRARQVIDETMMLLAADFSTGARWMDLRKIQDPQRNFGPGPTAALEAYHKLVPAVGSGQPMPAQPIGDLTLNFLKETPAAGFFPAGPAMPGDAGKPAHK
jgi:histidine ammonia-lyase